MTKQPKALRLADILQHKLPSIECLEVAAAELRRLHDVNQMLLKALIKISRTEYHMELPPAQSLEEQMRDMAFTAIAKAGEQK